MTKERRKKLRTGSIEELRAVFHRLWTREVGKPDYSKRDWQELQKLLLWRGIEV